LKFFLINIGKTSEPFIIKGIEHYQRRIKNYFSFIIEDLNVNYKSKTEPQIIKKTEATAILSRIEATDYLILLDEKGKEFTSKEFATVINKLCNMGSIKAVYFVTGGAFGFSNEIYNRANLIISLSKLTFPHQLVRLIFCEQFYRACTIIKGEKYHHD
jgi:23S rRNA (pseudouridine1915-N3)-methyltransferase